MAKPRAKPRFPLSCKHAGEGLQRAAIPNSPPGQTLDDCGLQANTAGRGIHYQSVWAILRPWSPPEAVAHSTAAIHAISGPDQAAQPALFDRCPCVSEAADARQRGPERKYVDNERRSPAANGDASA